MASEAETNPTTETTETGSRRIPATYHHSRTEAPACYLGRVGTHESVKKAKGKPGRRQTSVLSVDAKRLQYCDQIAQQISLAMCYGQWDRVNNLLDQARTQLSSNGKAQALAETGLPIRIINMLEERHHIVWIEDLCKLSKSDLLAANNNIGEDSLRLIEQVANEHEVELRP